ncbi:unnamed protein product [Ectocarpus fasciculatus]
MEDGKSNVGMDPDMDDDSDDEVSLLVVDEDELNTTLNEAGIQVKVDAEGSSVEVSVLSEDVSTFLMFAPEEEYLGAKVTGFVPREDGGLSALEMHGQLVEGDVLTHLNGSNARLLDFTDILKACRGPERGGLPRPLVMKFSRRSEALSPPASPAPSPPASPAAERGQGAAVTSKADAAGGGGSGSGGDGGGGGGATSGASSLLADLDDFMGGLSLPGGEARIPGMSHIKGVLRAELQAQGMLGGSGDGGDAGGDAGGSGNSGDPSPPGEGLFLNMLRRLENVDVAGEDSPRVAAAAAAAAADGTANGFNGDESRGGAGDGAEVAARDGGRGNGGRGRGRQGVRGRSFEGSGGEPGENDGLDEGAEAQGLVSQGGGTNRWVVGSSSNTERGW